MEQLINWNLIHQSPKHLRHWVSAAGLTFQAMRMGCLSHSASLLLLNIIMLS